MFNFDTLLRTAESSAGLAVAKYAGAAALGGAGCYIAVRFMEDDDAPAPRKAGKRARAPAAKAAPRTRA